MSSRTCRTSHPRSPGLGAEFQSAAAPHGPPEQTRALLLSDAPKPGEATAQCVAGGVGDDEFSLSVLTIHDRVLAKGAAKIHGLFALDVVDHPGGLTPRYLGLVLVAHALFHSVATQDQ